jgi:hypothetical protein
MENNKKYQNIIVYPEIPKENFTGLFIEKY